MADYTPTTEDVREDFAFPWSPEQIGDRTARVAAFDRWLAAHDAEVRSKALRDAADRIQRDFGEPLPGGIYLSTKASRRLRAMDEEERGLR